jgi:hypothetical protein
MNDIDKDEIDGRRLPEPSESQQRFLRVRISEVTALIRRGWSETERQSRIVGRCNPEEAQVYSVSQSLRGVAINDYNN